MAFVWVVLLALFGLTQAADPTVRVEQGLLQGTEVQGSGGTKPYFAFRGVPFGQPPTGSLRFKAPRPAKAWNGTLVANKEGSVCTQPNLQGALVGSEDCLYLNVYTPTVTCKAPLPVIVFFFGGAFTYGDGGVGWYGPDFIVNNDVVMVSGNYRVGPQGFLNLESASAPGNAGLKDAKQILEWTQRNVRSFCGDPGQVTVAGFSSGAMMSHALVLSPRSQGLFHRAFLMSGNALTSAAHHDDYLAVARALGAQLNVTDEDALPAAFAAATSEQLTAAYVQLLQAEPEPFVFPILTLTSEKEAASEADLPGSTLLTTDPETLVRTAAVATPVPILTGNVPAETLSLFLISQTMPAINNSEAVLLERLSSRFPEMLQDLALNVPAGAAKLLGADAGAGTEAEQQRIRQLVQKTYFGGKTTFSRDEYVSMNSGAEFYGPLLNYLRLCRGQVSLYETDVETDYNFVTKHFFPVPINTTAAHGDDIGYLFRPNSVDLKQDLGGQGEDAAVLRYVSTMVTDFVKGKSAGARAVCGSNAPQPFVHINGAAPVAASGFGSKHAVWKEVFDMRRNSKAA